MAENPRFTCMELAEERLKALARSEKAVLENPEIFLDIKRHLNFILSAPIDIGDYYQTAKELVSLLYKMGVGTIFTDYYAENLDPSRLGRAQHFRPICLDLMEQIKTLERWKSIRRKLRTVK